MRFLAKLLSGLLIVALLLAGVALFVLWPDTQVDPPQDPPERDVMAFLEKAVISSAAVSVDPTALTLRADASLTEGQLRQLLDFWYADAGADVREKVEGYRVIVHDGYAEVHVRARVLPFLSGQARLDIVPSYADGRIKAEVVSARIGRVSVPPEAVLGYISPDLGGSSALEFPISLPRPLVIDSMSLTPGGLRFAVSARVTSLGDLIELGKALGVTLQ